MGSGLLRVASPSSVAMVTIRSRMTYRVGKFLPYRWVLVVSGPVLVPSTGVSGCAASRVSRAL